MFAQPMLRLPRALPPRARRNRRPFSLWTNHSEPYRLPHEIRDRLVAALQPYKNREAAFALALFIARYWSWRVAETFQLDRRALKDHGKLDLTEARIRGAIRVLEEIGFLERALTTGSRYKPTEHGLRKRPIRFVFGSDYAPAFLAANRRAAAARGRQEGVRRTQTPDRRVRPSVASAEARANSPKSKSVAVPQVILGDLVKGSHPPRASERDPNLEAALERLRRAAGIAGDGSGKGGMK